MIGARTRVQLSETILAAFHHAWDEGDLEAACALLDVLDFMVKRPRSRGEPTASRFRLKAVR
jgi:hypothetical protein